MTKWALFGAAILALSTTVAIGASTQLNISVQSTSPPSGSSPAITVNGQSSGASVSAGSMATVSASGGPGNPLDWIGLCTNNSTCGLNPGDYSDYAFLANCSKDHPTAGVSSGSCSLQAFSANGNYYASFFPNNASTGPLAAAPFTVTGGGTGGPPGGGGGGAQPGSILPPGNWTLVFDDEFNGNGAPGPIAAGSNQGTSTQAIDWSQWYVGAEGGDAGGYNFAGPGTAKVHCSNTIWESGGSLHITTYGTVGVNQQSVANPSYGCELSHVTGGWRGTAMYWEERVNHDNNQNPAGWSSLGWLCCGKDNVYPGSWEIDVMEVNSGHNPSGTYGGAVFYNRYAAYQQIIPVTPTPPGWHVTGTFVSRTSGTTLYIDGVNMGSANPWGCSSSTPCTFDPQQFIFSNGLQNSSTVTPSTIGVLVDWGRIYYQ